MIRRNSTEFPREPPIPAAVVVVTLVCHGILLIFQNNFVATWLTFLWTLYWTTRRRFNWKTNFIVCLCLHKWNFDSGYFLFNIFVNLLREPEFTLFGLKSTVPTRWTRYQWFLYFYVALRQSFARERPSRIDLRNCERPPVAVTGNRTLPSSRLRCKRVTQVWEKVK